MAIVGNSFEVPFGSTVGDPRTGETLRVPAGTKMIRLSLVTTVGQMVNPTFGIRGLLQFSWGGGVFDSSGATGFRVSQLLPGTVLIPGGIAGGDPGEIPDLNTTFDFDPRDSPNGEVNEDFFRQNGVIMPPDGGLIRPVLTILGGNDSGGVYGATVLQAFRFDLDTGDPIELEFDPLTRGQ